MTNENRWFQVRIWQAEAEGRALMETPEYIGQSVHCPVCGEFDEGEPVSRRDFRGQVYEQDWKETHRCPKCGKLYEYENGNY